MTWVVAQQEVLIQLNILHLLKIESVLLVGYYWILLQKRLN